jgi:hypothetical protein
MKNITVTLDDATAAWVRVQAAEEGLSVSRYLGGVLRQHNAELTEYERAMRRFFDRPLRQFEKTNGKYATREEMYARPRVR